MMIKSKIKFPQLVQNYHNDDTSRHYGINRSPIVVINFYDYLITLNNYDGNDNTCVNVVISFDDKKYKKIYDSLKYKLKNEGYLRNSYKKIDDMESIIPDIFITQPTDFTKFSNEELIKYIKDGNKYVEDKRPNFDHSMFDIKYVENNIFGEYIGGNFKAGKCGLHQYGGLVCIGDKYETEDYSKIIKNNKPFIIKFFNKQGFTHFKNFYIDNVYYTDEFIVPHIMFNGCKL